MINKIFGQNSARKARAQEFTESVMSAVDRLEAHQALIKLHREDDETMRAVRDRGTDEWLFKYSLGDRKAFTALNNLSEFVRLDLRWADLRWADLRWADLRWADLRWARGLTEEQIRSAQINGYTMFDPEFEDIKQEILSAKALEETQIQRPPEPHA